MLNRDNFKVTSSTRVCSNHFVDGHPSESNPNPYLFMKGYDQCPTPKRRTINKHQLSKKKKLSPLQPISTSCSDDHNYCSVDTTYETAEVQTEEFMIISSSEPNEFSSYSVRDLEEEHNYATPESVHSCPDKLHINSCTQCKSVMMELFDKIHALESEKHQLEVEMHDQATSISDMKHDIKHSPFSIDQIKHSPSLMKLNTGITCYEKFEWIFKHIEVNLPNLKYYRGEHSTIEKKYHTDELMKPGPKRKLSHRDEMLLTLMKLRLDLLEDDMAFRFNISTSLVSQILSTWIPLLGKELSGLIYWPTREEVKQNYPKCFLKWPNVRTIIDCTEIPLQRPSMAKANTQIYSTYKGRPTAKALIGCTPGGTVSYISKAAGGAMSDKKLVKMSGIVNQFEPYDTCIYFKSSWRSHVRQKVGKNVWHSEPI